MRGQQELFIPDGPWREVRDGHPIAKELYERHYSARTNRNSKLICGPGFKLILLSLDDKALFVWRKFKSDAGETGINCAVFRNETQQLSSELILAAELIANEKWPGERLYTYVNARLIESVNPGCCFKKAGWRRCGRSKKRKLLIFEKLPSNSIT